ncbi:MAG TPA: hypothetical protein P5313_15245 [Spirochaetia bacterium]|nr:hypothetical protein [Spirochaetia bacterium]
MAQQKIRIQDDLWYVRRLVSLVSDAVKVQPDADLFATKVLEDAVFAQRALKEFKELLESNPRLMDRAEYLVLLSRSARSLAEAVSDLASGEGELSRGAATRGTDLEILTRDLRSLAAEIRDLASAALNDGTSDEDVVSGDELSELLRGEAP